MADNFNLRAFLTENKLTKNAKLLKEEQEDYKYFDEEGTGGFYMTTIDGVKIYSLEDSSIMDTCFYALEDEDGDIDFISIDVSGEPVSSEDIQNEQEILSYIADFIEEDINSQLEEEGLLEASSGDMAYTEKVKKKQVNNSKQLKEGQQLVELFTFGYDFDNIEEVEDYLIANYKVASNAPHILGIENDANPDCELIIGYGDTIINGVEVYNPAILQDKELMRLIQLCDGKGHYEEEDEVKDEDDDMYEASRSKKNKMNESRYSDSYHTPAAKAVNAKANQIVGTIRGYSTALQTIQDAIKQVEQEVGSEVTRSERNTLENHLMWIFRSDMEMERESVQNKKPVMEAKLTAKERKLVKLVENALGIQKEEADQYGYDPDNEEWEPEDDYPGQTRYVSRRDIEEGEEMVNEKPLPRYENIEKLMQEIEHGTNEAAYKHKMAKMKEVAEMLEAKVGSLEEGEGADFVDAKKVKQMKKDIMTLRKQAEKLEKEYDKKFAKKQDKKQPVEEGKVSNFDLKKFLVENKITTNSRMLKEEAEISKEDFIRGLAAKLKQQGFTNVSQILNNKTGMGSFEQGAWYANTSDSMLDDELIEDVEPIIYDYCDEKGVEVVA